MFSTYLRAAQRNLIKNWSYTMVNVLGLAVAISVLLLISVLHRFEYSYDKFYKDNTTISRVISVQTLPSGSQAYAYMPYELGNSLKASIPEVEELLRLNTSHFKSVVKLKGGDGELFDQEGIVYADLNYLDFFETDLLNGSKSDFEMRPNAVLITASLAEKYFGNSELIGEIIHLTDHDVSMEVVGVIADPPTNSSLQFRMIGSMQNLINHPKEGRLFNSLSYNAFHTFLKRDKESGKDELAVKIKENAPPSRTFDSEHHKFVVEDLSDLHLRSITNEHFYAERGDVQLLNWFMWVSALLLIMSVIGYGNLTLATGLRRVRSIGIRKTVGASTQSIFYQLIVEAVLAAIVATVVSFLIFELTLPYFENFVNRDLSTLTGTRPLFYAYGLAIGLTVGLMSGLYPAIVFSKIRSIVLLKGVDSIGTLKHLRGGILYLQFLLAFVFISTALYMNGQLSYILSKDLGYSTEHRLAIKRVYTSPDQMALLKQELLKLNGVEEVAMADFYPGVKNFRTSVFKVSLSPDEAEQNLSVVSVDPDFLDLYGIKVLEDNGVDIATLFGNNSNFALLNETAIRLFNLDDPVGKTFRSAFRGQPDLIIQGVVQDFHLGSLHKDIPPLALIPVSKMPTQKLLSLKYNEQVDVAALLSNVESVYRNTIPTRPFEYVFLEDEKHRLYAEENRLRWLLNLLTGLCLFITLSNVLGLTLASVQHRLKEISIRKVLGAGFWQLQFIQSRKLLLLMSAAFVVAIPVSYWTINLWKTEFVYRITVSPWLFGIALLSMLVFTFGTSGWITARCAKTNPVESLKNE